MKSFSLKRKFEETLSEGRGMQLFWLLILTAIVVLLFWGIGALVFRDMNWQDILSLFLDPGCFQGDNDHHDLFRLLATFAGMFLFSALLISVVSNMFENIADSFKNGLSRYRHKDHILILGGGRQLISMISALVDDNSEWKNDEIVVMTTQSIDELRTRILTLPFLDGQKEKNLRSRITFYFGERDNENNLTKNGLAQKAKLIFIIGEDQEPDHDSVNIRCCKKLQSICRGTGRTIPCYLIFQDSSTFDVYKYISDAQTSEGTDLRVDVINANEHLAEQVLVADHDGVDEVHYPKIDYRRIPLPAGGFKMAEGIREEDRCFVHFVIIGSTDMAQAMALTAAHICHFPNFKDGQNRTVISFVDTGMKEKMNEFVGSHANLFKLSHYRYITFDENEQSHVTEHVPDMAYGDFLDVEWEFIDGGIHSPGVRSLLDQWAGESDRSLSLALCLEREEDDTNAALHLPHSIYESGCPIFIHQQDYGDVLSQAKITNQFGNIFTFGTITAIQDDPLFQSRAKKGQLVNFIYNQAFGDIKYPDEVSAWYTIPEAHKFSSIYCANALHIRERSFGLGNNSDLSSLTDEQRYSLFDTEHRRWMMSSLLLGYSPVNKAGRDAWKTRRLSADNDKVKAAKDEFKALKSDQFIHMDITPYDDLIPSEKDKDEIILSRIRDLL